MVAIIELLGGLVMGGLVIAGFKKLSRGRAHRVDTLRLY